MLIQSEGTIEISISLDGTSRLVLLVDPEITALARALTPKSIRLNKQRFAPHITVVRAEGAFSFRSMSLAGKTIPFEYDPEVQVGEVYYWLNVYSPQLQGIRVWLGLSPSDWYTKPPDGAECFHTTIGNLKNA